MPLLLKQTSPLMGVWQITESPDELLAMLEHTDACLPFLSTVRTDKRKQEWLASRVLIKELLGYEAQVEYRSTGAPYLLGESLSVSISHTKGYAAVLLSGLPAAGIDIEYRTDRVLKIRQRYMTPAEEEALHPAFEVEHLLVHWCAKEALFKLIGQKEVDFCRHLHVLPFVYTPSGGTFSVYETRTPMEASFLLRYLVMPDFVLTYSL